MKTVKIKIKGEFVDLDTYVNRVPKRYQSDAKREWLEEYNKYIGSVDEAVDRMVSRREL